MRNDFTRSVTLRRQFAASQKRRRRVLLLAEKDLSLACKRYLVGLDLEVYDGREDGLSGEGTESDSKWLTSRLFPTLDLPEKRTLATQVRSWVNWARERAGRVFQSQQNGQRTSAEPDQSAVFFRWGEFDAIILQDLWLTGGEPERTVALGCVLASDDYYLRGNFAGRKIVLVTDPGLFKQAGAGRPPFDRSSETGNSETPQRSSIEQAETSCRSILRLLFDDNGQIAFLPLVGDDTVLPLEQLKRLLSESVAKEDFLEERRTADRGRRDGPQAVIRRGALLSLMGPLKRYVGTRAQVVLVDDDPNTLKEVFQCLACDGPPTTWPERPAALVLPLTAQQEVGEFTRFPDLVARCNLLLRKAIESGEGIIFVTDILFDRVPWQGTEVRPTGIDLIEKLRNIAREHRMHIGIVAFTGFPSPFITTSAYHRGADAVIFKGKDVFSGGHAHLTPDRAGIDRLLFMLAFLCFEKEFLRSKMRTPLSHAEDELDHLERVLPRHAVSPHLQEEWDDTKYLLETMITHSSGKLPAEVIAIHNQILAKYGLID